MQAECGEALKVSQRLRVMDENLVALIAAEGTTVVLAAKAPLESDCCECIKDLESVEYLGLGPQTRDMPC